MHLFNKDLHMHTAGSAMDLLLSFLYCLFNDMFQDYTLNLPALPNPTAEKD